MCCRCCTTLKVAATWGAAIHMSVGLLLVARYFLFNELLGDYWIPYLVYIAALIPLGAIILLAVQKEVEWLLRGTTWMFILLQIFGFAIRLLIPAELHSWTILQRISALFMGILMTAIYSAILILYARKLAKTPPATDGSGSGGAQPGPSCPRRGGNKSSIEGPEDPQPTYL